MPVFWGLFLSKAYVFISVIYYSVYHYCQVCEPNGNFRSRTLEILQYRTNLKTNRAYCDYIMIFIAYHIPFFHPLHVLQTPPAHQRVPLFGEAGGIWRRPRCVLRCNLSWGGSSSALAIGPYFLWDDKDWYLRSSYL